MKHHFRKLFSLLPLRIEKNRYERFFYSEDIRHTAEKKIGVSHLAKQNLLRKLKDEFELSYLVETGTYLGDMLYMQYDNFEKLYSIELSEYYYKKAKVRFGKRPKIELFSGDSGEKLKEIIPLLNKPTLFWLDGHYSGGKTALGKKECPIYQELEHIFLLTLKHIIVIDDARLFIGKNDYPTIHDLTKYVEQYKYTLELTNDAIILKKVME